MGTMNLGESARPTAVLTYLSFKAWCSPAWRRRYSRRSDIVGRLTLGTRLRAASNDQSWDFTVVRGDWANVRFFQNRTYIAWPVGSSPESCPLPPSIANRLVARFS